MSFIQEYKDNFFINKNNLFYDTSETLTHESLFEHPKDSLNKKKKKEKKSIIVYSSSSDDDDFFYNDYEYDGDFIGGKKISQKNTKKTLTVKGKNNKQKMTIVPTFINTIKGKIIYTNQTKLSLEPIETKDKNIILGTIIDLNVLKPEIKNKNQLLEYFKSYDVLPLIFNMENKNVINKNKKKNFFSPNSKLLFVTIKIKDNFDFYKEVIENTPYKEFNDISDLVKKKNYIIAHYIYENFFMFINNKKHNYEIRECFAINSDYDLIKQNLSEFEPLTLKEKIFLDDFSEILDNCKKHLSTFS